MQSGLNYLNSVKYEENRNIDFSPVTHKEIFKDAYWFIINQKRPNYSSLNTNFSKRNMRGIETPYKRWGHSSMTFNKSILIFGGRHSHRSLANIYSLDLSSFSWNKIEPFGQIPPARDSHSAFIHKNEIFVFGGSGSGKKLNDFWGFNLETKKWSRMFSIGEVPSPREGHSSAMIRDKYIMIYGGLDENDNNVSDLFLYDISNFTWHKPLSIGEEPSLRDSQSCCVIKETCYIFGGQGDQDKLFNDMYTLTFDIQESDDKKKFIANWNQEYITGPRPSPRTSHASISYKSEYIIVIGGEGYDINNEKIPLNDVWIYNIASKYWAELKITNDHAFDGRMCHSASIYGERIFVYGGMKNADTTLDSLAVLCLDGKTEDLEEAVNSTTMNPVEEINKNYEKVKTILNGNQGPSEEFLFISNTLNQVTVTTSSLDKKPVLYKDIAVDTTDLTEDIAFNFELLKKNYLNNMISWSFLKKISDFNQWPLGCIGNFLENSLKEEINSKNIFIDVKCYDKKIYTKSNKENKTQELEKVKDFTDKVIVLSIVDDGVGIKTKDFNQIMYSFSTNEKKEHNFFKFGISMKTSAIRLANSFLILTKTENEASIGLISKNMQIKLDTDFILSPIVNFKIDTTTKIRDINMEGWNKKYIPRSNMAIQSLNLILVEIRFLFQNEYELFNYFESFDTGTHILLYDLKQISLNKLEINQLKNYELLFDYGNKDILFNLFYIQTGEKNYIDCSLRNYIKFLFLKHGNANVFLYGNKVPLINPLLSVYNTSKNITEASKIGSNLKTDIKKTDCMYIEGEIYKGILMNENYFNILSNTYNFNFETSFEEKEIFNGILLYKNNRLICRLEQNKLGDISFFIRKYEKMTRKANYEQFFFPVSGFIELPSSCYELLYNKLEFKDQAMFSYFYSKIKNLSRKIKKVSLSEK